LKCDYLEAYAGRGAKRKRERRAKKESKHKKFARTEEWIGGVCKRHNFSCSSSLEARICS